MNTRSSTSSSIRRQLFTEEQPVGRSGEHRSDKESEKLLDQKQAEWNFDFRNGKPLPGRYEWIQVEHTSPSEAILRPVASTTITNESNATATDTAGVEIHPTRRRSRASVSQRYVPYDLRSRSRGIRNNELRISSVEHYRNRERSDNSSSVITRSNERLQSDVRT